MASQNPKKVAALIAAVLQHAAETAVAPAAPAILPVASPPVAVPPLWAWAGRQGAMADRITWQRRLSRSR